MERFAGRYELLRRLGRGGMGEVFLARDLTTGAECALKRWVAGAAVPFGGLRREFEVLSRLRHPSVVSVLELGMAPDGTPFYTMEYVPGVSAERAITPGDWPALFFVAAEVAHGLEALHTRGVFHGDLKPSNLLVIPGEDSAPLPAGVRLLDFGLSVMLGDAAQGHRGTPGYAAPEVVVGRPPDAVADLYGLGATLYALASGQPAYEGESAAALLSRQQAGPPSVRPLEAARAPEPLIQLVLRLMAPEPGERPQDAREVRHELSALHPAARRPLAARLRTSVLVGRHRELAWLEQRLARGRRRSVAVVLAGESGTGKTVLLRELAARATLEGRTVIAIACGTQAWPGSGAQALLRRLAAEAGAEVSAPSEAPAALRAVLDGEAVLHGESDLGPLVETAASWIAAVEERAGAPVILLDDGERLDAVSRALIRRLILRPEGPHAFWVWTRSDPRIGDDERMLVDARVAEALEIGALERDDMERLAAARLCEPAPEALSRFLWARGSGHPGLTADLLALAAERGAIRETDAGVVAESEALEALPVPDSFAASQIARFQTLLPEARRAGCALAALAKPIEPALLTQVEPAAGDAALEALVQAGLATRDEAGRLRWSSPVLAERVLESIHEPARRDLHRAMLSLPELLPGERFRHLRGAGDHRAALAAAEAEFETRPDADLAAKAARLAEAHAPSEAARWHERAGRERCALGRYHAALPHLERALEGTPPGPAALSLKALLATAYIRAGTPQRVGPLVAEALAGELPAGLRSRLLTSEAARLQSVGDMEAARTVAEEAFAAGEAAGDHEAVGSAAQSLVYSLIARGRPDAAESMAARAVAAHQRSGNALGQVRAMGARAVVAHARQRLDEAERLYREALEVARERGIRLGIEELLTNLAVVLTESGQWGALREVYDEAARLALEDHRPRGVAAATANLSQVNGLAGRPRVARRQARAAIRLTRSHLPRLEPLAWRSLAQSHRIAGRWRRAERAAQRALELALAAANAEEADWCRVEYARVLLAAGRVAEASDLAERGLTASRPQGSLAVTVLRVLAGRAALGDGQRAAAHLASADAWTRDHQAPYAVALTRQLRADLALARGRLAEAVAQADKTLAELLRLPAPVDRAIAALEFGRLAADSSGPRSAPAERWLELAAAAFERLGNRRERERALELLVQWHRETGESGGRAGDRDLIEAVSQLLNSLSDLRELSQRAMELVVDQLRAERGVLLLADPDNGRLSPIVEYGAVDAATRSDAVSYSRRVVQRVAESGGSLLIGDAPSDPGGLSDSMVDLRLRSIVCVPLYVGGRVMGAVYLDDSRRSQAFGAADRGLLEGFAHLMAVAIEKSRGHEEVRRANEQLVGENLSLRQEAAARFKTHRLIGSSHEMQRILAVLERVAQTDTTMMITGENGTGKELIARILHHSGKRRLRPFVAVNCGAIPENLLESELFGILPNVATGVRGRDGRFKQADGGTLFLDEIGDMPLNQQVALLSAISNREITPVGGGRSIPIDVRIIAATNRNLQKRIEEGAFREDLYYRLNVIHIEVPPLRERKADIPSLAHHFVAHFAKLQERPIPELSPEFLAALMRSDWPGNVRELQNYIERVMAMNPRGPLYPSPPPRDLESRAAGVRSARTRRLPDLVADLERRMVEEALGKAGGNQCQAARDLGIPEQAIRYRMRKYGIDVSRRKTRNRPNRRRIL